MRYSVAVKETSWGYIEVEAENAEEAKNFAYDEYLNGNVCWDDSDFEITEVIKA